MSREELEPPQKRSGSLKAIDEVIHACRRCPIGLLENEAERAIVEPRVILALGTGAARGLLGKTTSITRARGRPHPLQDGSELWVTAHPSYLLRLKDSMKTEQERLFAADIGAVARRLTELDRESAR